MAYSTPRLNSALPLLDGEIPSSHASRMAAYFRSETAREFCSDFDISFNGLCAGKQDELEKYSQLIDAEPADLIANAPIRVSPGTVRIGKCLLPTAYLARATAWLCPECAAEDMAAMPAALPEAAVAIRRDNIISAIGACQRHTRPFVLAGQAYANHVHHDFAHYFYDINERLHQLFAQAPVMIGRSVDTYIRARIEGTETNVPTVDPLLLSEAISVCGMFGNLSVSEGSLNLRTAERSTLNSIYQAGLDLVEFGEISLSDFFERRISALGSTASAKSVLGGILNQLYKCQERPEFRPLLDAVANAMASCLPGQQEEEFLRAKIQRRWYRLPAAAAALGLPLNQVKLLGETHAAIKDPSTDNGAAWIDLPKLREAFDPLGPSGQHNTRPKKLISALEAASALGSSRGALFEIVDGGLLKVEVVSEGPSRVTRLFNPAVVSGWASAFCGDAVELKTQPQNTLTLRQIKKRHKGPILRLLNEISKRSIWVGRLQDVLPYNSIVVLESDAKRILNPRRRSRSPDLQSGSEADSILTVQEFAHECGIGNVACHALVKNGYFRIAPSDQGIKRQRVLLERSEAERFKKENISLSEVAKRLKIPFGAVRARMAELGVEPIDLCTDRLTLFPRDQFNKIAE